MRKAIRFVIALAAVSFIAPHAMAAPAPATIIFDNRTGYIDSINLGRFPDFIPPQGKSLHIFEDFEFDLRHPLKSKVDVATRSLVPNDRLVLVGESRVVRIRRSDVAAFEIRKVRADGRLCEYDSTPISIALYPRQRADTVAGRPLRAELLGSGESRFESGRYYFSVAARGEEGSDLLIVQSDGLAPLILHIEYISD